MENRHSFIGTWKTRNGFIVKVLTKGYSAMHGKTTYLGQVKGEGKTIYWDENGNSLDDRKLDLMKRGVESYGSTVY